MAHFVSTTTFVRILFAVAGFVTLIIWVLNRTKEKPQTRKYRKVAQQRVRGYVVETTEDTDTSNGAETPIIQERGGYATV